MVKKIFKKSHSVYRLYRKEGLLVFQIRMLERLHKRLNPGKAVKLHSFAKIEDIMQADWSDLDHSRFKPALKKKKSYAVNWVMSPPGKGSGGHQNIFRFMRFLELAGHKNRIYLYTTVDPRSLIQIKKVLEEDSAYAKLDASIEWLDGEMEPADAIFATGWETAYPVFNSQLTAKRFYFVQDFEPFFYPVGSEYVLAENTYRFGFHGVTAGGWLANKLSEEYGMKTDNYEFGADSTVYEYRNRKRRKEIFFYARPVTARRGFEIGIMALTNFHNRHPEYKINLAGWDVRDYEIPFPYENLMSMPLDELSEVYNRSAAALVISLTNMSLMPLELLSCGTIPIVNDAPNNRLVSNNKHIAYTPNNPKALADKLSEIVTMKDLPKYAEKASRSVHGNSWDKSGKEFVKIFEKRLSDG